MAVLDQQGLTAVLLDQPGWIVVDLDQQGLTAVLLDQPGWIVVDLE